MAGITDQLDDFDDEYDVVNFSMDIEVLDQVMKYSKEAMLVGLRLIPLYELFHQHFLNLCNWSFS